MGGLIQVYLEKMVNKTLCVKETTLKKSNLKAIFFWQC